LFVVIAERFFQQSVFIVAGIQNLLEGKLDNVASKLDQLPPAISDYTQAS
jgi:hypothetical protein